MESYTTHGVWGITDSGPHMAMAGDWQGHEVEKSAKAALAAEKIATLTALFPPILTFPLNSRGGEGGRGRGGETEGRTP
jgi:hypothetical protein